MNFEFSFILCVALTFSLTQGSCQKSFNQDDLDRMVVGIADSRGNRGTGTIVSNNKVYWLITAAHVADSLGKNVSIVFSSNNLPVATPLDLFCGDGRILWKKHPEADIAMVELRPFNEATRSKLENGSFPLNQINGERGSIPREFTITVIGYPVITQIGDYFSPFTFRTAFSSGLISLPRSDTKKLSTFQMLENPSVQGYSGGPVIAGLSRIGSSVGPNETYIVGIVHGTYRDNTGGKMAVVTPSFYIFDLLK